MEQIQLKLMTKFFNKFKKPFLAHFCYTFPILGVKKISQKICNTSYGFLAPCQNLAKTNDTIPRKCPELPLNSKIFQSQNFSLLLIKIFDVADPLFIMLSNIIFFLSNRRVRIRG